MLGMGFINSGWVLSIKACTLIERGLDCLVLPHQADFQVSMYTIRQYQVSLFSV
jgi:hypothetical protein